MKSRKVAVALDAYKCSCQAFNWCAENLFRKNDDIILLHVYDHKPIELPDDEVKKLKGFGYLSLDDLNEGALKMKERKAQEMMREYTNTLLKMGFEADMVIIKGENVKVELCTYATESKIDLLALGNRGLGVVGRTFLGSVCDYCVHNAPCPVLVVKCTCSEVEGKISSKSMCNKVEAAT
ncbi:hypothetical protein AAMO2058_001423100 [Amorphochlora amoebiformis]